MTSYTLWMKPTKYCKSEKFQIGPNTANLKNFLKKTPYTLLMKKTSTNKYEKFQIGPNTENFPSVFFINVFPPHQKRFFFKNNASFLKKKIKKTSYQGRKIPWR